MTKIEKLLLFAFGLMSGIAVTYIHKCRQLQTVSAIQSEQISNLWEFINENPDEFE